MKLKLKEGWLVHTITYSLEAGGGEGWEFHSERPSYVQDTFIAAEGKHVPGTLKKIMYVEVEDAI